ncbi:MAG TPA: hypothetical protein VH877_19020 [Polyangia bacterium]|jgi:hypothetical protein|nr:hypothetical protein [Polyangia bacterium]
MYRIASCALFLVSLAGCVKPYVVIDGKAVPRAQLGYTDHNYFAINHKSAYPEHRGPSSGLRAYGGSIGGRICGVDVVYDTYHQGRHLNVVGFVGRASPIDTISTTNLIAYLQVRDRWSLDGGMRDFTGAVGRTQVGLDPTSTVVDFTLSPGLLRGRIGRRYFNLRANGDSYVGQVSLFSGVYAFELKGRSRLWSMPAADQAAVLPLMMTCVDISNPNAGKPILTVDLDPAAKS